MIIYTADVKREQVKTVFDCGGYAVRIEAAFLSELDSESIRTKLNEKVKNGEALTEEELMEFIILPLSYPSKEKKREVLVETVNLAEQIADRKTSTFVLSGLLVFSDKIMDAETRERIRRTIEMTQIEKMIRDEEAQKYEKLIAEKDDALKEKDDALKAKDDALKAAQQAKDDALKEQKAALKEKDDALKAAQKAKDDALKEQKAALKEKDDALKAAQKAKNDALKERDDALRAEKGKTAELVIHAVENIVRNTRVSLEDACRMIGFTTEEYTSAYLLLRQAQLSQDVA